MAAEKLDYEKFTPSERDNFVKFVLSEAEMRAAVSAFTKNGRKPKPPEEILEFCFHVAVKKSQELRKAIAKKRNSK